MTKYVFYVTTYQSGGEGKGNTQTYVGTDRHTDKYYRTGMRTYGNIDHISNSIGI